MPDEENMGLALDHIVVAAGFDLDAAMNDYRSLGFTVTYGGVHASGATHNALVWFSDGTFIELLALTGNDAKAGELDFSRLVTGRSGLVGWALRSYDLVTDIASIRANGYQAGDPIESGRLRPDGLRLAWRNVLIDDDYAPFLIEYLSPPDAQRVPSDRVLTTHRNGVQRICRVDNFPDGIVLLEAPLTLRLDPISAHGVMFRPIEAC